MDPILGIIVIDLFITMTLYFLRAVYLVFVFLLSVGYAYEGFKLLIDVTPRGRGKSAMWNYMITLFALIIIDFTCIVILGTPLHSWDPRPFTFF